jgi:hypothetical protein
MMLVARTMSDTPFRPRASAAHHQDGAIIDGIVRLEVVEDGGGFYLFQFDINDRNRIDTWHDSVEEALDQAAFEYGIDREAWEFVTSANR